jgi:hypothetical protein
MRPGVRLAEATISEGAARIGGLLMVNDGSGESGLTPEVNRDSLPWCRFCTGESVSPPG